MAVTLGAMIYVLTSYRVWAQETAAPPESSAEYDVSRKSVLDDITVNYFGIFHGPAIGNIGPYQPLPTGGPNRDAPIYSQNYLNVNKVFGEDIVVSAQGYRTWQPVLGNHTEIMDPHLRIAHTRMVETRDFSLYSDFRTHFPISRRSRNQDMRLGLQTFQVAVYTIPGAPLLSLGTNLSFRYNFYGKAGFGRKIETYVAPNVAWQVTPRLALFTQYEVSGVNFLGDPLSHWYSDGTDLEPGVRWNVNDQLTLTPYINLMVNDRVSWQSTQFGMMVNWIML